MNHKPTSAFLLTALAIGTVSIPAFILGSEREGAQLQKTLNVVSSETSLSKPMRIISHEGFFYEDFEDMTPGHLGCGWTALATPGLPNDIWNVATLGASEDDKVQGISGFRYAYILGNHDASNPIPHDSWLFSPAVSLNEGTEYDLTFFTYMAPGVGVEEEMEVYLAKSPSPSDAVYLIDYITGAFPDWDYHNYQFTPEESGEYHIAFRSISPFNSNATLIDDVQLKSGQNAGFFGYEGVDFGITDLNGGTYTELYRVKNSGDAPLELELTDASPEISVEGLPLTLKPSQSKDLWISFTPSEVGQYKGHFTLSTNDPTHPVVELIAISDVRDVPVTGFTVEDFESGGPKGWTLSFGGVNTDFMGGHKGPRTFYTRSFYTLTEDNEVGFTTHYVNMGENPELDLWYKVIDCDLIGNVLGATSGEYPMMDIYVSDDKGKRWKNVYSMGPGENEHVASDDYTRLYVPLPEYAGKECRVKVVIGHASNPLEHDFIFLIDDVALGSRPDVDLRISALRGESTVNAGAANSAFVDVENIGSKASGEFSVSLVDSEGTAVSETKTANLEPGERTNVRIEWSSETPGRTDLKAVVACAGDAVEDNNVSNILHASVIGAESSVAIDNSTLYMSPAFPIYLAAKETAVQTIYYANEIGIDKGEIASLAFTSAFDVQHITEEFEVLIAETDRTDFADDGWIADSEFTKVFEGQVCMPAGQYDFTIPFDAPYSYKGGNIVVMTRKFTDSYITTKRFLVHVSDVPRTTFSSANHIGTLVANGYEPRQHENAYSHATFNISKPDAGSVSGTVNDSEGTLKDVEIRLKGTQLFTQSSRKGTYSFKEISAGEHVFTASKYGYYPYESEPVEVTKDENVTLDIIMTPYPQYTVSGTIVSTSGVPVAGARVVLEGYADYVAVTDAEGRYTIENVYGDTGSDYNAHVESLYYDTAWNHSLNVDADATFDAVLEESVLRAHAVTASLGEGQAVVEWQKPLPEYSHDNGEPVDYLGWSHGHSKTAIFSVFPQHVDINEVRWYMSDCNGPHGNINILFFGLDKNGMPDPSNLVYAATGVPFTDNEWSSYTLPESLELDDFAVAVSGDGYIGLGCTFSDDEHPFKERMHFFSGDDYTIEEGITDFSVFGAYHPMIRVYGDFIGDPLKRPFKASAAETFSFTRPDVEYNVYRYAVGNTVASPALAGSTCDTSLSAAQFASLEEGKYRYGVVASYSAGDSEIVFANDIIKDNSGVMGIDAEFTMFILSPDQNTILVNNPEEVETLAIFSADGLKMVELMEVNSDVDVTGLEKGVYVITAQTADSRQVNIKFIKK